MTMATAQVFLQRFYFRASFRAHDVRVRFWCASVLPRLTAADQEIAMAAIFLAGKTEENLRKLRDVINVFHQMEQKRNQKPIVPLDLSSMARLGRLAARG